MHDFSSHATNESKTSYNLSGRQGCRPLHCSRRYVYCRGRLPRRPVTQEFFLCDFHFTFTLTVPCALYFLRRCSKSAIKSVVYSPDTNCSSDKISASISLFMSIPSMISSESAIFIFLIASGRVLA